MESGCCHRATGLIQGPRSLSSYGRETVKSAFLLGVLLGLPALLWAMHGHWIDHYRNARGASCCGIRDCVTVEARLVEDRGKTWLAEVNGTFVELPKGSVHLSQEPVAYWCYQGQAPCQPPQLDISPACGRCLFVAVGG